MRLFYFLLIIILLPTSIFAQSVMSSDAYKMQSDSLNFAGLLSSSNNYRVEDTLGELVSGTTTSTSYIDYLGYQYMGFAPADTEDPTAPSSVTAQTVSSSEIELTWDASTDNIAVDRYYIYRDGFRIDDVAIFPRSFSNTGLTPNTTYSYNISAVDDSGNESLWSATTSATTLSSSSSASTGGGRSVLISSLVTSSNDTNVSLSFVSSLPRIAEVYWGTDLSYADGLAVGSLGTEHNFLLENLRPGTFYHLKIILRDEYGGARTFESISFRTLTTPISRSPSNVSNFRAEALDGHIDLSWRNPADSRVVGVRVVRRNDFYPATPSDGEVVFQSEDNSRPESFIDSNVQVGVGYYYTIFTIDLAGNTSSGVVTSARLISPNEVVSENPLDNLLPAGTVDPLIEKLEIEDFLFIQSGDSVDVSGGSVFVEGDKTLTVALKYYRVPEILKTIAVTLVTRTPEPEHFTFILRPNRDKTRYEATIGSLGERAVYTLRIDTVDYKNQGLKTLRGTLEVVGSEGIIFSLPNNFVPNLIFGSVFGLMVLMVGRLVRRSRKMPLIDTHTPIANIQP